MLVTADNYAEAIQKIIPVDLITVDLETNSLNPYEPTSQLCGIAVEADGETFYFPFFHGEGDNLEPRHMDYLKVVFSMPGKILLFFNGKFDLKFLLKHGFAYPTAVQDAQLAAHLANENEHSYSLKSLAKKYISPDAEEESDVLLEEVARRGFTKRTAKGTKGDKGHMWRLPASLVAPYAEQDVLLTKQLRDYYIPFLRHIGLMGLWLECNQYLLVVMDMESRGLLLDQDQCNRSIEYSGNMMDDDLGAIESIAGFPLNPNSPKQVCAYFSIPSSNVEVLEEMTDNHVARLIIDYRRHSKMRGAYYAAFMENLDRTGVIHPNLNMTGTVSARFSCSEPNLQAIPRGTNNADDPRNGIKRVFVARPGYWLVQADYKQAEIYLGAHYAKSQTLISLIEAGVDLHSEMAANLGIPRYAAKRMNFAMQYGVGAETLAHEIKKESGVVVPVTDAQKYITIYKRKYPEVAKLYQIAMNQARHKGFIQLFTGRMRRYDGRMSPYQKASSNLIQGGVAEIMRISATNIWRNLRGEGVSQLLHVHDSIMFEVPKGREWLMDAVAHTMTTLPYEFAVKFRVDVSYGERWSELNEYQLSA